MWSLGTLEGKEARTQEEKKNLAVSMSVIAALKGTERGYWELEASLDDIGQNKQKLKHDHK